MKVLSPPHEDHLHLSTQLITTLISETPNIQTFKGKFSLITTKLTSLTTHLKDLSDLPNFSSNPLSSDLLFSIHQTLTHTLSVTHRCKSLTLSSGKLRTQSDIDSISANLDQHIKDLDLLIRSGLLQEKNGVVGCSKREAVRVEARNLMTRLQIGNRESKNSAIDALLGLLQEDDKNVLIAVAQGAVPLLVRLLDSSSSVEVKEKAVSAISRVSMVDSIKHVLVAEGILLLNHLLRVIESGSGFAKERACVALQALSFSKENARAIGSRGGISSLLEICQSGSHTSQAVAAGVLRNLAEFHEIKLNFVEENAVPVLIGLAASGTAVAQENSIGCLCNLAFEDEDFKLLVVREGGIECLKNYWDAAGQAMVRGLEVAVGLLWNLASCRPIGEVLFSKGFICRLAGVLSCGVLGVRIAAAKAVYELGFCTKARKEIGESGCVPPLVRMLDAKAVEEKDAASKALSSVMQFVGNRRLFRKEERAVVATVQLLDPSIHNLENKYPILVLISIAQSKKCRRQMVAAGACAYLEKLVEMEVEGAKKLMENLGRGKMWGVFNRT